MRRKCSASAGLRCRTGSARGGTGRTEARSDILELTAAAQERGYGQPRSLSRTDDLVELLTLYVGVDLHPQRKVIGHLKGERGLVHSREQLLQAPGVEIDHARLVREILRIAGVVQNLIVALVLGQVRAEGLALEGGGHLKPFPGQGRELFGRFDIEVPDYDEILVLGGLLVPLQIDPFCQGPQLHQAPRGCPPLRVRRQKDEIETAGAERRHEGLAPPVEFGQIQVADFLARWIGSGGESAECDCPLVVDESDAFVVSARISQRVGIDDPPGRPEHFEDAAQIGQVVAQFRNADEIELTQDLGDVVNRRLAALLLAELPDVPCGDVERLVELRRRNLGVRDSRLQDLETLGDFRRNISVVHDDPLYERPPAFAPRIARQIRSGVAGISKRAPPACRSASATAFMSAGSEPLTPASPTPFAPSGFVAVGTGCSRIARPFTRPARGIGESMKLPVRSCPVTGSYTACPPDTRPAPPV